MESNALIVFSNGDRLYVREDPSETAERLSRVDMATLTTPSGDSIHVNRAQVLYVQTHGDDRVVGD